MGKTIQFNPQSDAPLLIQMTEENMAGLFVMIEDIVRKAVREQMNLETEGPLTSEKAAKFLDIHPNTLYRRMKQPDFPVRWDGGTPYFFASELVRYIKGKKK